VEVRVLFGASEGPAHAGLPLFKVRREEIDPPRTPPTIIDVVSGSRDADEAIALATEHQPDIVIVDA
jgi:hypothetical protein